MWLVDVYEDGMDEHASQQLDGFAFTGQISAKS
jgi:hypothetical protein